VYFRIRFLVDLHQGYSLIVTDRSRHPRAPCLSYSATAIAITNIRIGFDAVPLPRRDLDHIT
jgi:hypothetical protein